MRIFISISVILLNISCVSDSLSRQSQWKRTTLSDLNFIYDVIKDSHPGPIDHENPGFKNWLEEGKKEATKLANQADSYEGYEFAIKRYVEGFNDGHLGFWTNYERSKDRWPGFVISYRAGRYVVYESKTDKVKKGDELISCDQKKLDLIFKKNIYPFKGTPEPASRVYSYTPHLTVDKGNPFIQLPTNCQFKRGKQTYSHILDYTKISRADLDEKITNAKFGPKGKFKQEYLGNGTYWFSITTFGPDKSQQKKLYDYIAKIKKIRNKAKAIVFDVRGNSGGSSKWGELLMESLNGKNNVEIISNRLYGSIKIDWRVSKRNLESVRGWPKMFGERFGEKNESTIWAKKFLKRFEKAYSKNDKTILQGEKTEVPKNTKNKLNNIFKGKVYFLTDGRCGSACLDFADLTLSFPNSIHIGLETSADTVYMEGNVLKTPSKLGSLFYPMKVWRGRKRGNRESYKPKHVWKGEIADTKSIKKWITNGLEEKWNY